MLGVDFVVFDGLRVRQRATEHCRRFFCACWGLRKADLAGFDSDGFLLGDDGVTLLELALGEVFLKILEANFDVEFTAACDDVLT